MTPLAAVAQPQASLYEVTIEHAEVETALEAREKVKARLRDARKAFKEADDKAKGLVETLELGDDAAVRVGRFVLTRRVVAGRSVSFETGESARLYIKLLEELP
jgi:hypothetical protein